MALCFLRHGSPDLETDAENPTLSELGRQQASRAAVEIAKRIKKTRAKDVRLITSPKSRCVETIDPLARELKRTVEELPQLRLRDHWESAADFVDRLRSLADELKLVPEERVVVVCSHADVLEFYLSFFAGPRAEVKKANFFWVAQGRVTEVNPL